VRWVMFGKIYYSHSKGINERQICKNVKD